MALMDTSTMMIAMGLNPADSCTYQRYDLLRQMVESAVKSWLKWSVEEASTTQYFDGTGYRDVVLRAPFVTSIASVYLDPQGNYGYTSGSFASSTLLTVGVDYVLVLDDGTQGKSGLLRKLSYPGTQQWFPGDLVLNQGQTGLSYVNPPWWPAGYGNIKAVYTFGFTPSTLPDDFRLAVTTAVAMAASSTRYGNVLTSENLGAHSISMTLDPAFGQVRQVLARYRDTSA